MTTIPQWVDAFRSPNLTVTGVARYYNAPPESADMSDGPIAYPWIFTFDEGDFEFSCSVLNEGFTMTYEVVTNAVAQSDLETNYDAVITMAQAVRESIEAMTIKNFISFSLAIITRPIGDVTYWAIRADVQGTDKL